MKDNELTKRKLIDAIGSIIRSKGFAGIRISKVAREAGVDRKLVYRYFGNLRNLTEAYISENDYWMLFADHFKSLSGELDESNLQPIITDILKELFHFFIQQPQMQDLIMMELLGSPAIMRSIHNVRETIGQQLLETTDRHFKDGTVNFRAVAALIVGGIYFIVLHAQRNAYHFARLDLQTEKGREALTLTVEQIIDWAFKAAKEDVA